MAVVTALVYIPLRQQGKRYAMPFLLACAVVHALSELWMALTTPAETLVFLMEAAHSLTSVVIASLAGGRIEVVIFVAAMLAGMIAARFISAAPASASPASASPAALKR